MLPLFARALSLRLLCLGLVTFLVIPAGGDLAAQSGETEIEQDETRAILRRKREGIFQALVPLFNMDPDTGIGFGGRYIFYDNGPRDDPNFQLVPYRHRLVAQVFYSTRKTEFHRLEWTAPRFTGSLFRLTSILHFQRDPWLNYYGWNRFDPESNAEGPPPGAGTAYHKYEMIRPHYSFYFEREFLGGNIRPVLGGHFSYADIDTTAGKGNKNQVPSRLERDLNRGLTTGTEGGWQNSIQWTLAWDSRDFEPNPARGSVLEWNSLHSQPWLLSDYQWNRYTLSYRQYFSLLPFPARMVLAWRTLYFFTVGTPPVFAANQLPTIDGLVNGLGGLRTLRGYRQDEFTGSEGLLLNGELRLTLFDFTWGDHFFEVMIAPFIDSGQIIPDTGLSTHNWATGYGAGLRLAWNRAVILFFDRAINIHGGEALIYIDSGHNF